MTVSDRLPGNEWVSRAACAGMDQTVFYPENGEYGPAKRICEQCPVKAECGTQALMDNDRYGCKGGLTPFERGKLRKQLGLAAPKPPVLPCGTMAAVKRHYRHGEPLDDACRVAQMCWQNPEQKPMGGDRGRWR